MATLPSDPHQSKENDNPLQEKVQLRERRTCSYGEAPF
ncbi:hypothetical protein CCACVL1_25747 [Corchorus capsularis]|uniref:Uncharacterized protein n=1 Tax=Corchorus capsularis TaxID=210143 RepID=A0A1R3GHK9_COCAP|nr:hypothetical protein CCACVL1_25747 [Corchorus capsularis]